MSDEDKHGWTHAMCDFCWKLRQGPRQPVRLTDAEVETCCWCGVGTQSGIYVRAKADVVEVPHCPDVRSGAAASTGPSGSGRQPTDHPDFRSTI